MRTLKKSLCLVLALVFVLGLCTIGAGATAFTDDAKISYKNAVTVMNGLGIITGDDNDGDGKLDFRPQDNVTREEAAKLVTYMVLGAKNAERVPAGDGGFSDVDANRWSAKYINFCASKGYIKGLGDGTFNPKGNIKGTELATLLLRVAGYGMMGEYEGKGWDINAVSDALAKGIFEDAETEDFAAPATREETALYFFNTLTELRQVTYDVDLNRYVFTGAGQTFGTEVWDLEHATYQITGNAATGDTYTEATWTGVGTTPANNVSFKVDTDLALIAHEVEVYYRNVSKKDNDNNTYYEAYMVEDLSTVIDKGSYKGDLYRALIAANKNNGSVAIGSVPVWSNYVKTGTNLSIAGETNFVDLKDKNTDRHGVSGDVVVNASGMVLAVVDTEYTIDQVTGVTADAVTLKADVDSVGAYDRKLAYEGIKKGDYVTVQPVGSLYYIYPTTTQTSDITACGAGIFVGYFNFFSIAPGNYYGTVPTISGADSNASVTPGAKVLFYMDYYGSYFALDILQEGTSDGTVFAIKYWSLTTKNTFGDNITSYYVQAINEAGEEVIYTMANATPVAVPAVYNVYLNAKTGAATMTAPTTESSMTKNSGSTSYLAGTNGTYYVNSDTTIYYVNNDGADLKVTKASALTKTATGTYYVNQGANNNLKTIWIVGAAPTAAVANSYIYVAGSTEGAPFRWMAPGGSMSIADTQTYYWKVYVDGEVNNAAFLATDGTNVTANFAMAGFYTYTVDENNIYTLTPATTNVVSEQVLTKGDIHNGRLYVGADGYDISKIKVVNVTADCGSYGAFGIGSAATDSNGTKFLTIDSVADIESLLEDGYSVSVSYIYKTVSGNRVPLVIYVNDVPVKP